MKNDKDFEEQIINREIIPEKRVLRFTTTKVKEILINYLIRENYRFLTDDNKAVIVELWYDDYQPFCGESHTPEFVLRITKDE